MWRQRVLFTLFNHCSPQEVKKISKIMEMFLFCHAGMMKSKKTRFKVQLAKAMEIHPFSRGNVFSSNQIASFLQVTHVARSKRRAQLQRENPPRVRGIIGGRKQKKLRGLANTDASHHQLRESHRKTFICDC